MKFIKHLLLSLPLLSPFVVFSADQVNINTADKKTLMAVIAGVGEKRAESIIEYREKNGPFKSIDDLVNIKGVGQATIDKHRDILTTTD